MEAQIAALPSARDAGRWHCHCVIGGGSVRRRTSHRLEMGIDNLVRPAKVDHFCGTVLGWQDVDRHVGPGLPTVAEGAHDTLFSRPSRHRLGRALKEIPASRKLEWLTHCKFGLKIALLTA
ncbi:hypothetical protein N7E02_12580 [Aliirhizobium terrae]|uniref:hypothetical protein n=1 Tax=Terrirhizobium terrae TaxID=2926709 RepID=UPI002578A4A0|nr:hypothetical protein [Rhizobium sp. CC-CFT758]WJH41264.1 hypothetical protein N7E02_12580 [Rhizobium sp. CC-CFT758]